MIVFFWNFQLLYSLLRIPDLFYVLFIINPYLLMKFLIFELLLSIL